MFDDDIFSLMFFIVFGIVAIIIYVVIMLVEAARRKAFMIKYDLSSISNTIKVRKGKKENRNYFVLRKSYWYHHKKDGTKDERYTRNNRLVKIRSELFFDKNYLYSYYAEDIYELVLELRRNYKIELCNQEKRKLKSLRIKKEKEWKSKKLVKIANKYEDMNDAFTDLCGDLLLKMGYEIKEKIKADECGLYLDKNGEKTIVLCKCIDTESNVGKPFVKKIIIQDYQVDNKKIITTGNFTAGAKQFAEEENIELIDGEKFIELLDTYGIIVNKHVVDKSECFLTEDDF